MSVLIVDRALLVACIPAMRIEVSITPLVRCELPHADRPTIGVLCVRRAVVDFLRARSGDTLAVRALLGIALAWPSSWAICHLKRKLPPTLERRSALRRALLPERVNYRYVRPSAPPADVQCSIEQPIFVVNLLRQTSFV
jgi:hypothetical protein